MKKNNSQFEKKVEPLRRDIDRIDDQILSLLGRRQDRVEKVVRLKKGYSIPVWHPAREEDLISRLRDRAADADLDPDFLEDLYRIILQQSRNRQAGRIRYKAVRENAKVLIVGGRGQMGRFFAALFRKSGYAVSCLDAGDWENAASLCSGIDLCLISVPIDRTISVIRRIGPHLPPEAVLADVTSIKQAPVETMLQVHPGPVTGLHPIFGPTAGTLNKQLVAVCPGREDTACQWLLDQLVLWDAVLVRTPAREHDDIMGIVQALRHFATFCFGRFLYEKQVALRQTLSFSSPIYRLELGMVGRLFAQDARLYAEIIFASPERRQLLKEYISSVSDNLNLLEKDDKEAFCAAFEKIRTWFGPFSEQAMRESTFLIDRLIERF